MNPAIDFIGLIGKHEDDPALRYLIENYPLLDTAKDPEWQAIMDEGRGSLSGEARAQFDLILSYSREYAAKDNELRITLRKISPESKKLSVVEITLLKDYKWEFPFKMQKQGNKYIMEGAQLLRRYRYEAFGTVFLLSEFLAYQCLLTFYYNTQNGFEHLSISSPDLALLNALKFNAAIKHQKENIVINAKLLREELLSLNPALVWAGRMAEGDSVFTDKNISAGDAAIVLFINEMEAAVVKKSPTGILAAAKKITKCFNKLNKQFPGFIDTLEREDLAKFIYLAVTKTGLQAEQEFDITRQWRTDW